MISLTCGKSKKLNYNQTHRHRGQTGDCQRQGCGGGGMCEGGQGIKLW